MLDCWLTTWGGATEHANISGGVEEGQEIGGVQGHHQPLHYTHNSASLGVT